MTSKFYMSYDLFLSNHILYLNHETDHMIPTSQPCYSMQMFVSYDKSHGFWSTVWWFGYESQSPVKCLLCFMHLVYCLSTKASSCENGTYHIGEQPRLRPAWASAQSCRSLHGSLTQYEELEEASDKKTPFFMRHLSCERTSFCRTIVSFYLYLQECHSGTDKEVILW